ncbi:homoserine kinase [Amphibacillus sp. MSJ-3]|uniref:homoserine kinase n=1 Tax=Amphibacillus sp. MSJ-3 TaxID=2841505 RepID=UPI001C0F15E3|nr:homoserine kinase [Amphibacillus sp. MSJ-3]MBU5595723.1 homoserine kinase [Amphibacillus sp. MSJ-3]
MSWKIKVPATTANIGAGFDSIGIALNLYLTLTIEESNEWEFIPKSDHLKSLPRDQSNIIYQMAKKTAERHQISDLPACHVELESDIPLARGLGSSATAIVAGIELANQLADLKLSSEEKVLLATEVEGHPDNVAPAVMGGCVVGHFDQTLDMIQIPIDNLVFVTMIPDFELKTREARSILPQQFTHGESVKASSVANVSVAAICQQNWSLLGKMFKKDSFHQPYRKTLIPYYDEIEEKLANQVYGIYLSGAGPTMIALASQKQVNQYLQQWEENFPDLKWLTLEAVNQGAFIIKN